MDLTITDIQNMTPEEKAELNRKLARKIGKQMLTKVAIASAIIIGFHIVEKKLDARWNETPDVTDIEI